MKRYSQKPGGGYKDYQHDEGAISEVEEDSNYSEGGQSLVKPGGPIIMRHIDVEKFLSPEELLDTKTKLGVFYDTERRFKLYADGMELIQRFVNPLS
jgi:hypothetical protein